LSTAGEWQPSRPPRRSRVLRRMEAKHTRTGTTMITMHGRKSTGHGCVATENLRKQLPYLAQELPELSVVKHGTVNIVLDSALIVANPDYRTKPITWQPQNPDEIFDFLRIRFRSDNEPEPVGCWLYIAYQSDYRKDLHRHEIIASRWLRLGDNERCSIEIPRVATLLPYRVRSVVVI
jgi:hypothetical protein